MYYIYAIHAKDSTGRLKTYIGSRTAKKMAYTDAKDDFFVKYFSSTSSKELRYLIKNGQTTQEILKEFDDPRKCLIEENRMIKEFWDKNGKENSWNHSYITCNGNRIFCLGRDDVDAKTIRKKQGKSLKKWWENDENKQMMSEIQKQFHQEHPEVSKAHSEYLKQYYKDHPEAAEEISKRTSKYYKDHPEAIEAFKETIKKYFSDPENRKKMSEIKKQYYKDHPEAVEAFIECISGEKNPFYGVGPMKGKHHTEENRKIMSEKRKQYIKDNSEKIAEANKKISKARRKFIEEHPGCMAGENNNTYGLKWMNNGKNNIYVKVEEVEKYLEEGYKLGMKRANCIYKKPDGSYIIMDISNGNKHKNWKNCGRVEEIWYI